MIADRPGALSITLALPPRALCGNGAPPASRGGKIGRSGLIRATRKATAWVAREAMVAAGWHDDTFRVGLPPAYFPTGRVRVDVLVHRDSAWSARRLDDDNFWRGLKPILDGLAEARVVANDQQFRLGTVTWGETRKPLRGEMVVILTAEDA
ncbi:MAG: hypothetical protein ACTHMR_10095 [Thermomicrobiales bacterium]